jgi:hypothetical protein
MGRTTRSSVLASGWRAGYNAGHSGPAIPAEDGRVDDLLALYSRQAFYFWLASIGLIVLLLALVMRLRAQVGRMLHQYQRLIRGSGGANLNEILDFHLRRVDEAESRAAELESACIELDRRLGRALQQVGVVRFNAFSDTGGDQSFSVALLDANEDGVVFSSLFNRSDSRVFAKPVTRGASKYPLTDEERRAIEQAAAPVTSSSAPASPRR